MPQLPFGDFSFWESKGTPPPNATFSREHGGYNNPLALL